MAPRAVTYPTNHLLAVVDDPGQGRAAADALLTAGFAPQDVVLMTRDDPGAGIVGLGQRHSLVTRVVRTVQFMTMDQMPDFARYEEALADGRAVVAVHATDRRDVLRARDLLRDHGAHFLNYYGRVSTEELGRWRDPTADWIERPFPEAEARRGPPR